MRAGRTQAVVLRPDGVADLPIVEVKPAVVGAIVEDRTTNRKQGRAWACDGGDFRQGDRTVFLPASRCTPLRLPGEPLANIAIHSVLDEVGSRFSLIRSGGARSSDRAIMMTIINFVLIAATFAFLLMVLIPSIPAAMETIKNMIPGLH